MKFDLIKAPVAKNQTGRFSRDIYQVKQDGKITAVILTNDKMLMQLIETSLKAVEAATEGE